MAPSSETEASRDRQILVRLLGLVAPVEAGALANRLIERFGRLHAIVGADPATLATFLLDHPMAAAQLSAVHETMVRSMQAVASAGPLFPNTLAASEYLMLRLASERSEQIRALYLDSRHMLIRDECAGQGSVSHAPIYPREILRRALELGASSLILAHNHPSGDLTPSRSDLASTRKLVAAGLAVDVQVLDHLIVSRSGCRSLRADGLI